MHRTATEPCHVTRRRMTELAACWLLISTLTVSVFAQTDTVVTGVVADSSVVAPIAVWNRSYPDGDTLTFSLNGWTMSAETTRRRAPGRRVVASVALTPVNSRASDRIYVAGERRDELAFEVGTIEATFGRNDMLGERLTSDVRIVGLYEHVDGVDSSTSAFWSSPYIGLRTRQSWRHVTAEDLLLGTFEGSELIANAEVLAGRRTWSRARIEQRFSRRFGRFRAGESVVAFGGRSINTVNAFLVGGSWPIGDLRPLYGYRYAELRLDRGIGVNGDLHYVVKRSIEIGAHVSALRSRAIDVRGIALDVSGSWRGVGLRIGAARSDEDRVVVYGSILAAKFIR